MSAAFDAEVLKLLFRECQQAVTQLYRESLAKLRIDGMQNELGSVLGKTCVLGANANED